MITLSGKQLNSIYNRKSRQFTLIDDDGDEMFGCRSVDGDIWGRMLFKHNNSGKCYLVDACVNGWPFLDNQQYQCSEVRYSFKKVVVEKTMIVIDGVGEFPFAE